MFYLYLVITEDSNNNNDHQYHQSKEYIWKSVQEMGLHPNVLVVPEAKRVFWMMHLLHCLDGNDIVCFVDAQDTLVYAHESEILEKYLTLGHDIVFAAQVSSAFTTKTNFENIHPGGFVGRVHAIRQMLQDMITKDSLCFSSYFEYFPSANVQRIGLDTQQTIFQTMTNVSFSDINFIKGRVHNKVLNEKPCFVRLNGFKKYGDIIVNTETNVCKNIQQVFFQIGLETKQQGTSASLVPFNLYEKGGRGVVVDEIEEIHEIEDKKNKKKKNIICCVYVKVGTSASMLSKTFENLNLFQKFLSKTMNVNIVFVYDDIRCEERIKTRLETYQKTQSTLESSSIYILPCVSCHSKHQTVQNAMIRNEYIDFIYFNSEKKQFDFHLVIDIDPNNTYVIDKPWNMEMIQYYMDSKDIDPNPNAEVQEVQEEDKSNWDCISFYHPQHYLKDAVRSLFFGKFQHQYLGFNPTFHDSIVYIMKTDLEMRLQNYKNGGLFPCDSAFNGFALYRTEKFQNVVYDGFCSTLKNMMGENVANETLNMFQHKFFPNIGNFYIDHTFVEQSEHVYYHLSAIRYHGARIRITQEPLHNEDHLTDTNKSIFFDADERLCRFVSSRGLVKSCDLHPYNPCSSASSLSIYNSKLDGAYDKVMTVYVCNSPAMHEFIQEYIKKKRITYRFVLVSGDCDWTCPTELFKTREEFITFMETENLVHWFSQNCIVDHDKLSRLPIGLDYHTLSNQHKTHFIGPPLSPVEQESLLVQTVSKSLPFWRRKPLCYSNFHFTLYSSNTDRSDAMNQIPPELVFYEKEKVTRQVSLERQIEYAFVLSPRGNGRDCNRTWEALVLGCIPIVKMSPIDSLYDDLPVLCVRSWSDISESLLADTLERFRHQPFSMEKLTLSYWTKKMNSFV